jgi:hypothetical protein
MHHLVYSVKYSVVPINSSLLTMMLYSSVRTTFAYDDKIFSSFHDVITEFHCILFSFEYYYKILWLQQPKETEGIIFMVYIRTTEKHSYMYLYWPGERKQDIYIYIYIYMSSLT